LRLGARLERGGVDVGECGVLEHGVAGGDGDVARLVLAPDPLLNLPGPGAGGGGDVDGGDAVDELDGEGLGQDDVGVGDAPTGGGPVDRAGRGALPAVAGHSKLDPHRRHGILPVRSLACEEAPSPSAGRGGLEGVTAWRWSERSSSACRRGTSTTRGTPSRRSWRAGRSRGAPGRRSARQPSARWRASVWTP